MTKVFLVTHADDSSDMDAEFSDRASDSGAARGGQPPDRRPGAMQPRALLSVPRRASLFMQREHPAHATIGELAVMYRHRGCKKKAGRERRGQVVSEG